MSDGMIDPDREATRARMAKRFYVPGAPNPPRRGRPLKDPEEDEEDDSLPPTSDESWEAESRPMLQALDLRRMTFDEIFDWYEGPRTRAFLRQVLAWLSFHKLCDFRDGYWTSVKSPPREPLMTWAPEDEPEESEDERAVL